MADVYQLTLEGPGKNALGTPVMRSVITQLATAAGRPVLVTGAGDAFSAGLNLKEVASLDAAGMERYLLLLDDVMDALFRYPGPTVAAVNGHAIAGGCVVALCCDYRVALDDPRARIGLNEVALGLEFPPKIMRLIRYRVPRHTIERVTLQAGLYPPREAHALGLVDEVAADVQGAARSALDRLAAHPPVIYAATKQTVRGTALDLDPADRRYFRDTVLPRWCAPEVKERVLAQLRPKSQP
jgi:enoyl-CoA hydratase